MAKDCAYYREQIELDLDHELPAVFQKDLNNHLAVCLACRQYQEEAVQLWTTLEECLMVAPPADVVGPVWARIRRRRNLRWIRTVSIFLIGTFLAGLTFIPVLVGAMDNLSMVWIANLLGSLWNTLKVLGSSWAKISKLLPDGYWLALSGLAAINLAMLIKLLGFKAVKGGNA